MKTWTPSKIRALKGQKKFATITSYDATMAYWVDQSAIPLILVGDSLGMVMQGFDSTIPVTLDMMVLYTAGVSRVVKHAVVVADLPFGICHLSQSEVISAAMRLMQEGGADAVKLEGGAKMAPLIQVLVDAGIPVMGHIGLTPQSVFTLGGYKVQGREEAQAQQLIADAQAIAQAGAFSLVTECIPATLGKILTESCPIPVVGIGAGAETDGQILVIQDMLGLNPHRTAKFVKHYANLGEQLQTALTTYAQEVESSTYPSEQYQY